MTPYRYVFLLLLAIFLGCKNQEAAVRSIPVTNGQREVFVVAFGSCNKHDKPNPFWDDILTLQPDLFIWGGDIVYADSDDITKIEATYRAQLLVPGYAALLAQIPVTGTWDDHDYGLNDGGGEFSIKAESQQAFLDFMGVSKKSPRRQRQGVYSSQLLKSALGSVKIINLDTRYFRTPLTNDPAKGKRYRPNPYGQGTILGEEQWTWLDQQLKSSKANFNIIVSSIQFLSNAHGFEKWGNHPHEVDRLKELIVSSKAKSVIVLSGDRHISEFSKTNMPQLDYPLVDFTSSGLTHAYQGFSGEPNPFRVGGVTHELSFGLLYLDARSGLVTMQIMTENGKVLQELKQRY